MGNQSDYGNNIEGIPLPGDIPQVEGSAAPNEPRSYTLHNPDGETEPPFSNDYFEAEQRRQGGARSPYIENKDNREWSPGVEDEENDYGTVSFSQLDNDWNEGAYPETQPLQVEGAVDDQSQEELESAIELEPDNIQHGPD